MVSTYICPNVHLFDKNERLIALIKYIEEINTYNYGFQKRKKQEVGVGSTII